MEKSWENFWTTGRVEDYLTYRNRFLEQEQRESGKECEKDARTGGLKPPNAIERKGLT